MLFTTTTQLLALALVLIAGWLLGLASSSGGKKWRERYRAEETAHKQYRGEVDADLKTREARLREVEAERDRYRSHAGTAAVAGAGAGALANRGTDDRHLHGDTHGGSHGGGIGGWFGWNRDNLSRIRGIDQGTERALEDHGIKTFRAIEGLSADDERELEERLNLAPGTIDREGWREQAAMIREGRDDQHRSRFGM